MNCACHRQVKLNELVFEINKIMRKNIKPIYDKPRQGDIKQSFANIKLIGNIMGFKPNKDFIQDYI